MAELQKPQPQKNASQGGAKPPLPFWRAKSRADSILDLDSSSPVKVEQAKNSQASNARTIAYLEKKIYDAERADDAVGAEKYGKERDFVSDLFEYAESLFRAFDSKKKAFNVAKDNLQIELEAKLKKMFVLKVIQRSLPWLGGVAAGSAVYGSGIWNLAVATVQDWLPAFDPKNVQEVLNIAGIALVGCISYGIDALAVKRNSRLASKYAAKKAVIDSNEQEIRENILKLVEIEYDRLANVFGYEPFKLEEGAEHDKAHEIAKQMERKYGLRLPLPDSLLNGDTVQKAIGRWRGFFQKQREAFSALFGAKPQSEVPSSLLFSFFPSSSHETGQAGPERGRDTPHAREH